MWQKVNSAYKRSRDLFLTLTRCNWVAISHMSLYPNPNPTLWRASKPVPLDMFLSDDNLISGHVACTLSSSIIETNLLWSRSGLLEIIGRRGTMSGALSFRDCANYQSNLDGLNPDIPIKVKRLSKSGEYDICAILCRHTTLNEWDYSSRL